MLKYITYAETEGYDLIISEWEDGTVRYISEELLDAINMELPAWIDIWRFDRPSRAEIVFRFLDNYGNDDNWDEAEDFTKDDLLNGVKIIAETEIYIKEEV